MPGLLARRETNKTPLVVAQTTIGKRVTRFVSSRRDHLVREEEKETRVTKAIRVYPD